MAATTGVKSLCMERLRNPITTPHVSRTFINAIPVTQCPILDVSRLFEIRFQTPLGRVGFFQFLCPHKYLNSISILYFHVLFWVSIAKSYTCISGVILDYISTSSETFHRFWLLVGSLEIEIDGKIAFLCSKFVLQGLFRNLGPLHQNFLHFTFRYVPHCVFFSVFQHCLLASEHCFC